MSRTPNVESPSEVLYTRRRLLIALAGIATYVSARAAEVPKKFNLTKFKKLPLSVSRRPFSIEPFTGVMLPDGVFDCALFRQEVTCFIKNSSAKRIRSLWVRTYPRQNKEWQLIGPWQIDINNLPPNAAVRVSWLCDFRNSTPGKKPFGLEVGGTFEDGLGFDGYIGSTIFVSKTTYDAATKKYSCEVPEGILEVEFTNSTQSPPFELRAHGETIQVPALPVPTAFTAVLRSSTGHELEIPFNDPWWKVVAWIIATVSAIGAFLEAAKGNGYASVGIGGYGHDDPTKYHWCFPDPTAVPKDQSSAGILSTIANAAIAVGLMDQIDPWERGRIASGFVDAEVPRQEDLSVLLKLPDRLPPGRPFVVGADWTYAAKTSSGRTTKLAMSDAARNIHEVKRWDIDVPNSISSSSAIVVRVKATLSDGSSYFGEDLYAFAVFTSPGSNPRTFRMALADDGRDFDKVANDGWYSVGFYIENLIASIGPFDYRGEWTVAFFAQNVNAATPGMPAKIAATFIGGNPVLAPFQLKALNSSPPVDKSCPIDYVRKFLVT